MVGFDHSHTGCIHFLGILKLPETLGHLNHQEREILLSKGSKGNKPEDALDSEGFQAGPQARLKCRSPAVLRKNSAVYLLTSCISGPYLGNDFLFFPYI